MLVGGGGGTREREFYESCVDGGFPSAGGVWLGYPVVQVTELMIAHVCWGVRCWS